MDRIRIGLIGAGLMGRLHARVLVDLPYVELAAITEPNPAMAAQARGIAPGARFYTDYNEMLAQERLDGVVVATPETLHRGPVEAAARRGLHVLVEKPLAVDPADGAAMVEACRTAGVQLMVGYILRFKPAYAALQQAVASGRFGRPVAIYARRNATIQEAERLGGRVTAMQYIGVHDMDQVLWHHPAPVRRVRARAARGRVWETLHTPDVLWTEVEFAGGAVAIIEAGWALHRAWGGWDPPPGWGAFGDVRFDLTGTAGFGSVDLRQMNLVGVDDAAWMFPETRHWPQVGGAPVGALRTEVEHFLRCIRTGQPPMVDGAQGLQVTRLLHLANLSLAEDREITWEEVFGA